MNFVAIDLGASNTRYVSIDNRINFLPNNVEFLEDITERIEHDRLDDVVENNLDVLIEKEGASDMFPMRILVGALANRFGSGGIRPDSSSSKVEQRVNYASVVLATALSKLKNEGSDSVINVFTALPPRDVTTKKQVFIDRLKGNYKVTLSQVGEEGTVINFTINDVMCLEESRLALLQFIFDEDHPERVAKFSGSDILSIDIGASTSDLVIFKEGKYINKTGKTYTKGCNTARETIKPLVSAEYGIELTDEGADMVLTTGRVKNGNKFIEVPHIVDKAKKKVAQSIIKEMTYYFQGIDIPISSINYIIVSGGGSMVSSYIDDNGVHRVTSAPMSEYITSALKTICSGIDVIDFGEEPRLANIRGLAKMAILSNGEINRK